MEAILNGLTEEQRNTINAGLEAAKRAARAEAVDAAKLDFRAGVAGSRKPDSYDPLSTNITSYLEGFEPFRAIMALTGGQAINTFLTYLDGPSRTTLAEKELTQLEDWNEFKERAMAVLSPPKAGVQARYEIKKATQTPDESVAQFGKRLLELGKVGYRPEDANARDSSLKDALSGGVLRDEVGVQLINNSHETFQQCLEEAIKLDASYRAREALKGGDGVTVSILKTELQGPASQYTGNFGSSAPMYNVANAMDYGGFQRPHTRDGVCHRCQVPGHWARECPNVSVTRSSPLAQSLPYYCHYCGKAYHVAKDCRTRLRDEQQSSGRLPLGTQQAYNVNVLRQTSPYNTEDPTANDVTHLPTGPHHPNYQDNSWFYPEQTTPRHNSELRAQSAVPKN